MSHISDTKSILNIGTSTSVPISYETNQVTVGDASLTNIISSSTTCSMGSVSNPFTDIRLTGDVLKNAISLMDKTLPDMQLNGYNKQSIKNYIQSIKQENSLSKLVPYTHGVSASSGAYVGGVYCPRKKRIYLVPNAQANPANALWHYINCETGTVVAYAHGVTTVTFGYHGGVYSPTQDRIYLVPLYQASQLNWHYIDCVTGAVVAYAHGITAVTSAYVGGCYSATQNRIYFSPLAQASQTNWHYIDCSSGAVVAYPRGVTVVANGYFGSVYSPSQDRIYLVPFAQGPQTDWHYIDVSVASPGTGIATVVAYPRGVSAVASAYVGGCYSPYQNRIYFVPHSQAASSTWHYISCDTDTVVSYTNNSGITPGATAYHGGVYSPTQNRIYFVPLTQATQTNWHYINCDTGDVVFYPRVLTVATGGAYTNGAYCPIKDRVYFAPSSQATNATWHYIPGISSSNMNASFMAGPMFNKF